MNLPIPMDSPPNSPKFPKPALLKVANLKGFWLSKAMEIGDDDQSCSFVNDSSQAFILVISRVFVRKLLGIWFGFLVVNHNLDIEFKFFDDSGDSLEEMEFIYDMRGQMEKLYCEMSNLRKVIKSCVMQMVMQHSMKEEVHSASFLPFGFRTLHL